MRHEGGNRQNKKKWLLEEAMKYVEGWWWKPFKIGRNLQRTSWGYYEFFPHFHECVGQKWSKLRMLGLSSIRFNIWGKKLNSM